MVIFTEIKILSPNNVKIMIIIQESQKKAKLCSLLHIIQHSMLNITCLQINVLFICKQEIFLHLTFIAWQALAHKNGLKNKQKA